MTIETKYNIGQWIKHDRADGFKFGVIQSILVYSHKVYYSTGEYNNIEEEDIKEAR